jgi:gliding motility-associated-like protein
VVCLDGNRLQFRDSSSTDGQHAIQQWSWSFGDGTIDSTHTTFVQHSYAQRGTYAIALKVTDAYGCTDVLQKDAAVIIAKPVAAFTSPDTLSCTNKPIAFQNSSTGISPVYSWNFGDATTATFENGVHQYSATGTYTVSLKVTDSYGCVDTHTKAQYISISNPLARFDLSDSVGACPPFLVHFTNRSTNYTGITWDFGDGNTSTLANPSHYYTVPGVYHIVLRVEGVGGCIDTYQRKVEVKGPNGTFSYNAQPLCKPAVVALTATTTNAASILWDLGDGNTQSGLAMAITHTYPAAGSYIPKMILTDAAGCRYPVIGADTIKVIGVDALYTLDRANLCDSGLVSFTNHTVSNDLITSWQWDFGDGSYSTTQAPSHRYKGAGTYRPKLVVRTEVGCVDTATSLPITVYDSPIISIVGDSAACMPATLQLGGRISRGTAANLSWSWSFGNGQTAMQQTPSSQLYVTDGTYLVQATATDNHSCSHTISKAVVVHPVPATNAGADVALCQDATAQLSATGAIRYAWQSAASLSCITCPSPTASPRDTASYVVIGFSNQGCAKSDTVKVFVRKRFQLLTAASDTVCIGGSTQLWAKGADSYSWSPAAGLENATSASPKASPTTTTNYKVIATDKDHCFTDTATVTVKVYPIPVVSVGADQTMSAGGTVTLTTTNSSDINNWKWAPAATLSCATCPSPKAAPRQTTTYKVQVRNDGGCTASDDVTVSVICNNGNLFIPNTFSPNGDGSNERFYPRGTGIHAIRSFRIFNRWGEVVYERLNFKANDAASGWDGTYRGRKAASDVYIYTCEVVCSNGEVLPFKGDITLLQ